jgi:hypothetical protein
LDAEQSSSVGGALHGERISNRKITETLFVLQILAIENFAISLLRCSHDK